MGIRSTGKCNCSQGIKTLEDLSLPVCRQVHHENLPFKEKIVYSFIFSLILALKFKITRNQLGKFYMYKTRLTFLLFIFGFAINSFAQSAGLNFTLGFPSGEFKDNVKRTGFGISGQFIFFNPQEALPFSAGLNVGFLNY